METLTFYMNDYQDYLKLSPALAGRGWSFSPGAAQYGRDTFQASFPSGERDEVHAAVMSIIPGVEVAST